MEKKYRLSLDVVTTAKGEREIYPYVANWEVYSSKGEGDMGKVYGEWIVTLDDGNDYFFRYFRTLADPQTAILGELNMFEIGEENEAMFIRSASFDNRKGDYFKEN